MSEKIVWETVPDDNLVNDAMAVAFLSSEFQPVGVDDIWFRDYFQWKLGSANPAGKGYLTVGISEGKVIATISLSRKRVLLNSTEYIAAEFGDAYCSERFFNNLASYVPKEPDSQYASSSHYFNKSIFGRIAHETTLRAQEEGVQILFGTPNQNAYPSWIKRLGHFELQDHHIHFFSRPTLKYVFSHYSFAKPFARILSVADKAIVSMVRLASKLKTSNQVLIEREIPGETEMEALWDIEKPVSGFSLVRDFSYWNYRYFTHPMQRYSTYSVRLSGKLCGIVTTCMQKIAANSYRLYFVEWMVSSEVSLDAILTQIIYDLRHEPIDNFVTYANANSAESSQFKKNLFQKGDKVTITFFKTDIMNEESLKGQPFQFYMGSTDAI